MHISLVLKIAISDGAQAETAPEQTPGSVALLSLQPVEEANPALKSALGARDPEVRAVAARVVAFADRRELAQMVLDALARLSFPKPIGRSSRVKSSGFAAVDAAVCSGHIHARADASAYRTRQSWRSRSEEDQERGADLSVRSATRWSAGRASAAGCRRRPCGSRMGVRTRVGQAWRQACDRHNDRHLQNPVTRLTSAHPADWERSE